MQVEVLKAGEDAKTWHQALADLPSSHQAIYFAPEYHQTYEVHGGSDGPASATIVKQLREVPLDDRLVHEEFVDNPPQTVWVN